MGETCVFKAIYFIKIFSYKFNNFNIFTYTLYVIFFAPRDCHDPIFS